MPSELAKEFSQVEINLETVTAGIERLGENRNEVNGLHLKINKNQ